MLHGAFNTYPPGARLNMKRHIIALAATLLVTSVWAQTTSQPLNLKLPPNAVPASSSTAAQPASSSSSATAAASSTTTRTPGVYYGDTSGHVSNDDTARAASTCDDSTYNQAQMHGSVSTGVVSGSHMGTGMWNAGEVNVTKAFGDCDHPSGGVSISVGGGVGSGGFYGRGH